MSSAQTDVLRRDSSNSERLLTPRARAILGLICLTFAVFHAVLFVVHATWELGGDMDAYWQAAVRLRGGGLLYPPIVDVNAHDVYRYAPWFASLWIPLTYLPKALVTIAWSALMFAATAMVLQPLLRRSLAAITMLFILAPLMAQSAWYGQVQPLMVLAIATTLGRRFAGPTVIGLAASMKIAPILFALVFIAKRQWFRAIGAVGLAAILGLPTFLFDLTYYPFDAGPTVSLWALAPWLWAAAALWSIAAAFSIAVARPRWVVLAAGAATIMAGPRIYVDLISYLMPALHHRVDRADE